MMDIILIESLSRISVIQYCSNSANILKDNSGLNTTIAGTSSGVIY
jgi:hypothetical protein